MKVNKLKLSEHQKERHAEGPSSSPRERPQKAGWPAIWDQSKLGWGNIARVSLLRGASQQLHRETRAPRGIGLRLYATCSETWTHAAGGKGPPPMDEPATWPQGHPLGSPSLTGVPSTWQEILAVKAHLWCQRWTSTDELATCVLAGASTCISLRRLRPGWVHLLGFAWPRWRKEGQKTCEISGFDLLWLDDLG